MHQKNVLFSKVWCSFFPQVVNRFLLWCFFLQLLSELTKFQKVSVGFFSSFLAAPNLSLKRCLFLAVSFQSWLQKLFDNFQSVSVSFSVSETYFLSYFFPELFGELHLKFLHKSLVFPSQQKASVNRRNHIQDGQTLHLKLNLNRIIAFSRLTMKAVWLLVLLCVSPHVSFGTTSTTIQNVIDQKDALTICYNSSYDRVKTDENNVTDKTEEILKWLQLSITIIGFVGNAIAYITLHKNGHTFTNPAMLTLLKHQSFLDMIVCLIGAIFVTQPPMWTTSKEVLSLLVCQVSERWSLYFPPDSVHNRWWQSSASLAGLAQSNCLLVICFGFNY